MRESKVLKTQTNILPDPRETKRRLGELQFSELLHAVMKVTDKELFSRNHAKA